MAQSSFPWTDGTGDGGPYSADTWDNIYAAAFLADGGVNEGVLHGLKVSGTASPVSVAAGAAVVNGKVFISTATETVSVPTPASSARYDRVVLRADYAAQTVRIARLAGTEGSGSPPALTQSDGVTWEISLAKLYVTTGGVITVTDERAYCTGAGSQRMPGEIIMWSGALSGHYPVHPRTGLADTRWHICNGDVENGVATPNLLDKFVICAGSTYASGTSGGSATKNLAHTHGVNTITVASENGHTHGVNITSEAVQAGLHNHTISSDTPGVIPVGAASGTTGVVQSLLNHNHGGLTGSTNPNPHSHSVSGTTAAGSAHSHSLSGSTAAGSAHTHALSGSTASGGSSTQDIMPPYYALVYLCYVGD